VDVRDAVTSAIAILACPICDDTLTVGATAATCPNGHSFDLARQGYLNLLRPDKRHSPEPGDSAEMLRHRRSFLQGGYYDAVAAALSDVVLASLPDHGSIHVADLGCGEGFFLARLHAGLVATRELPVNCIGVDISRAGIRMATTYDRRITWLVASLHHSPFRPASLGVVISMFAPIAPEDVQRVLKPDGVLVTVTPGPDHLDALRAMIYPTVAPHAVPPAQRALAAQFDVSSATRVRYGIQLKSPAQIMSLLAMTPFYWNISLETMARVEALSHLEVTVDVSLIVRRRR
jgi:23S rRNA (guanine745-N1)-methyltransferase